MTDRMCMTSLSAGNFTMTWPERISLADVEWSCEFASLQFATMRRYAQKLEADAKAPGDIEYESWLKGTP